MLTDKTHRRTQERKGGEEGREGERERRRGETGVGLSKGMSSRREAASRVSFHRSLGRTF